ncbi:hypothetical protein BsWGS_10962 [Bradybaena similaris]
MISQSDSSTIRPCFGVNGLVEYDDKFSFCCDGEVKRRVGDQSCCEKTTYFQSSHLCCGGKVVNRYHAIEGSRTKLCTSNDEFCREQVCCGNTTVEKNSSLCCQNTHVLLNQAQILEREILQCCGAKVMNITTHFCCGGSAFPINSLFACCGDTTYLRSIQKCLDHFSPPRVVNTYENYCGDSKYDTMKNSCCNGVLNDVPERDPENPAELNAHRACCESIAYNSTKNKCCRSRGTKFTTHIIPNEANVYCCGDGWYNNRHQDCHEGVVLVKMPGKIRCAFEYIDGVSEKCCGDALSYNPDSHDCCEGDRTSIISKHEACCNGEGMNDNELCCGEQIRCIKRHSDDDECCYNSQTHNGTTYNSKNHEYCVEEEVMIVPPGAKPCTRSNYYYPATQICCGDRVENASAGYDQCCGTKPYKSKSQQCCGDDVSNIPSNEGSCCDVDNRVYRINDTQNPCLEVCGRKTYHSVTHMCCNGVVHARRENHVCCGSSTINSVTAKCCGGLFQYPATGSMRCCADRELYDIRHSKCQNNKIVPIMAVDRRQPDVQHLCNNMALMHFDGAIRYACESIYVITGRLVAVFINKDINPDITYIRLSLVDVRSVNRGANFTPLSVQKNLNFTIEVPNTNGVTCKKRFIDRCCNAIVFFNAKVKNGHVTINADAKFFMTRYNRKRENMITKQVTHTYCVDKYGVGKKKPINSKNL